MKIEEISMGKNAPEEVNVIVENSANALPVKYELDKKSGALFVDRFLATPMHYPCNYGFVPNTLSEDGDPVDVLVISEFPVLPGAVIPSKLIGVLIMEDEKGMDEKLLAVPTAKMKAIAQRQRTALPDFLFSAPHPGQTLALVAISFEQVLHCFIFFILSFSFII